MGKTTVFAGDFLKLILNATAIADLADNDATSPLTALFVSLHTADPGVGGSQNTNEISYTGYARVSVARTAGGWTVVGNVVSPTAAITFGQMTAGAGGTATFAGIGTLVSGAGKLMWSGTLTPNIVVINGVTPVIPTTSTITET